MNTKFFYFLYSLAHRGEFLDKLIVFFALYFPYFVILVAGVFILMHHEVIGIQSPAQVFWQKKKEILEAFYVGAVAWILSKVLKTFLVFERPVKILSNINPLLEKTDHSFPSGHATFFMALAFTIYFFHKKAGYWFMFFALLIGLARIAAGVHFPADILGGFILGALVALAVKYFKQR